MMTWKKLICLGLSCCVLGFLSGYSYRGLSKTKSAVQALPISETPTEQAQFPTEVLFSPDSELAKPFLEICLAEKEGDKILLAWILGSNSEIRMSALRYFLKLETEPPRKYESIIDDIVKTSVQRKLEIRELADTLDKPQM